MCGRYTLVTPAETLVREFGLAEPPATEVMPSYNVTPEEEVAAVVADDGARRLEMLRWGLIPSWSKDPSMGARMINARGETVAEKPSFRAAFKKRRCLIPADGFYEWQKTGNGKQPFYIRMDDGFPFAFAGLWEVWQQDGGPEVRSCTIITTEANELLAPVHHRMPVILPPDARDLWLDPSVQDAGTLLPLISPYPSGGMETYPVSRFVNNPANDDERCIHRAA